MSRVIVFKVKDFAVEPGSRKEVCSCFILGPTIGQMWGQAGQLQDSQHFAELTIVLLCCFALFVLFVDCHYVAGFPAFGLKYNAFIRPGIIPEGVIVCRCFVGLFLLVFCRVVFCLVL